MMKLIERKTESIEVRDSSLDRYISDIYDDGYYQCGSGEYVKYDHDTDSKELWQMGYRIENVEVPYYFNPQTNDYERGSHYLASVMRDDKVLWLANMVTYYRHQLQSWNKCWGEYGGRYRRGWFGDYDEEKRRVNERQKRKIARVHKDFLKENGITVDDFKQLQYTDQHTIEFVTAKLSGEKLRRKMFVPMNEVF